MGLIRILLAPARALRAVIITLLVLVAVLTAVLVFLAAALAAVIAYLKREQWTLPAYRWVRDRSGRWRYTPWSSAEGAAPETGQAPPMSP